MYIPWKSSKINISWLTYFVSYTTWKKLHVLQVLHASVQPIEFALNLKYRGEICPDPEGIDANHDLGSLNEHDISWQMCSSPTAFIHDTHVQSFKTFQYMVH